jgi:hypothetical protein
MLHTLREEHRDPELYLKEVKKQSGDILNYLLTALITA